MNTKQRKAVFSTVFSS